MAQCYVSFAFVEHFSFFFGSRNFHLHFSLFVSAAKRFERHTIRSPFIACKCSLGSSIDLNWTLNGKNLRKNKFFESYRSVSKFRILKRTLLIFHSFFENLTVILVIIIFHPFLDDNEKFDGDVFLNSFE